MVNYLNEDDLWKTPTPATPSATPKYISEEEVFGTPRLLEYGQNLATSFLEGAKGFVAQGLRGEAAAPTMPAVPGESEAEYQLRLEEWRARPQVPLQQNPLWRAAGSIDEFGRETLGATPGFEDSLTRDVGGGFGSLLSILGMSYLNPSLALLGGQAAGQGEAAQRAIQSGATEEQARRAAYLGTAAGATELVDILLPKIGGAAAASGFIRKVGVPILKASFAEGGQEGVQQLIQNAIAKGVYKPDQDYLEGVPRSVLVGAIVGGGFKGGQIALGAQPQEVSQATPDEVALARSTLMGGPTPQPGTPKQAMSLDDLLKMLPPGAVGTLNGQTGTAPPAVDPAVATAVGNIDAVLATPSTPPTPTTEVPPPTTDQPIQDVEAMLPPRFRQPPSSTPFDPLEGLNDEGMFQERKEPLEGEVLPPLSNQMPAEVVDFLQKNAAPLEIPTERKGFSALLQAQNELPLMDEVTQGRPGANTARLARLLGPKLYGDPTNMATVTVKEMFQNAFDGIKGIIQGNPNFQGKVDVTMDPETRTISLTDNGTGMTPQVLGKEFLEIAGTKKESDRASGGLGIAKMMFLFGNKRLHVVTARDGKVSTMSTTGEDLFGALEDPKLAPKITTRKMVAADYKVFPNGSGTHIQVQVPETFQDPSTGEAKEIGFDDNVWYHKVLRHSPLFDNIDVTFNGRPVEIGNKFPVTKYTQFANVNFDWGTARIYITQGPVKEYEANTHILSNGLWQFSQRLQKDPNAMWGDQIERRIFVDVSPKVRPEDSGYPFDLNRQGFAPSVKGDFDKIFKYIQVAFQQAAFDVSVENFGTIRWLDLGPNGSVVSSNEMKLVPPEKGDKESIARIKSGDKVEVKDGKLSVNGKEIPELSTDDLQNVQVDISRLRIPQSEIDSNGIILHDNTLVHPTGAPIDVMNGEVASGVPSVSLSQLAVDKFGGRFYEFMYFVGGAFRQLRDVVSKYDIQDPGTAMDSEGSGGTPRSYASLKEEGLGISFDPEYRGVSIRVPFRASFINPAIPVYTDPLRAAVGTVGTMVHELAHHHVRNHGATFPAAMQELILRLDTDPTFNFQKFKQQMVNVYADYADVFKFLNDKYNDGSVELGGKRFADSSSERSGDGSVAGDLGESVIGAGKGFALRDWSPMGQDATGAGSRRADAGARTQSNGTDPSFGKNSNQRALDGEADPLTGKGTPGRGPDATQYQSEFQAVRSAVSSVFGGTTPRPVAAMAAHADRINWWYKWTAGLTQLTDLNPRFTPLVSYTETVRMMHNDEAKIHDAATRIAKDWRGLGAQGENLTAFIHDLTRMVYRTPSEVKADVERHPSPAEFDALVTKHKLSGEALKVFRKVDLLFKGFIDQVVAVQTQKAVAGMTDIAAIAAKVAQVKAVGEALKQRPYFPFMNFGRHFVMVKNVAGDTVEFHTFERLGVLSAERRQQAAVRKLEAEAAARGLGETVRHGILPESSDPFVGMPPQLLELIKTDLKLTPDQLTALDQLRLQSTSSVSFRQRFSNRSVVPGYSMDFQRAFAKYFFHGARYYARTKYAGTLEQRIAEARAENGNKASRIADYMRDHLDNTVLDAKGDYGLVKGGMFIWAMGYVPAAAWQNLSQTPMITFPFLAGKFGDFSAMNAMRKAMQNINSFYKKGYYEGMVRDSSAQFELRAIDYGITSGRISETQSADLAGLSQGEGLIKGIGGNAASRAAIVLQEKSAWMFEMAEQLNRRIAFRAGLYLGQTKPNSKEVKVAITKYAQEFAELQMPGRFTEAEAKAIITAIHVVDQTQYVYARYARSRFMRGRVTSVIFLFKQYLQSTLYLMGNNKKDVLPRLLIIWMFLGGLASLPGWEDLREIVKGVARWKFGKDFDIEKELRSQIMALTGSDVPADLVLHGLARKGFGIPALLDLMGNLFTGRPGRGLASNQDPQNVPAPVIDMSRQISMGTILPFEIGKLIAPDKASSAIAEQTQKASGAAFSVAFNMYKAIANEGNQEFPKRWEKAVPRALGATSRMFRSYAEGRERLNIGGFDAGNTLVDYNVDIRNIKDIRDTEKLMELLAIGAGFQTERVSTRWERITAQAETEKFYKNKRDGLLAQLFEATKGGIKEEVSDMLDLIERHNRGLPDYARGYTITRDTMRRSLDTRTRLWEQREAGVPAQKAAIPISEYLNELYPNIPVDMRRAR